MDAATIQARHPDMSSDEAGVWERGLEHLEEQQGKPSKAELVHERVASETATLEDFHGESLEVHRVPLKRLRNFIKKWAKFQNVEPDEAEEVLDEDADELGEEACQLAANLVAEPDTGFTYEFFSASDYGLELGIQLIMASAEKFTEETEDAEKFRS